jgi:hypothetical protein
MDRPTIYFDRSGPSGNIYAILGAVSQALRKQCRYTDFNTLRDRVFEAQSYEEALQIIGETVNLVEIHK